MKIIKNFYLGLIMLALFILVITFLLMLLKNSPGQISTSNEVNIDKIPTIQVNNPPYSPQNNDEKNTIDIYQRLNSAVVNINTLKTEYIRYFFDIYPQTSEGQGSGAIIDPEGYIITNYHVVEDADKVTVTLSQDEGDFEAEIIGTDPENDLAVIKIKNPKHSFTAMPLGTSNNLKIGQKVYAIGNPYGLDRTLTTGIISGLGRPIKTEQGTIVENAIQTDASINPGNSGGPLIDYLGKMIGLNTMIISPSGGSIGLGFAIPVDTIKSVVKDLKKFGYVKRGWIDATFLPVTPAIARTLRYKVNYGLMIMKVARNGESYQAGLRGGDEKALYGNQIVYIGGEVIVSVDGITIKDYSALANVLKDRKPGEIVKVEYYKNNKKYSTKIKLIDKRMFTNN